MPVLVGGKQIKTLLEMASTGLHNFGALNKTNSRTSREILQQQDLCSLLPSHLFLILSLTSEIREIARL